MDNFVIIFLALYFYIGNDKYCTTENEILKISQKDMDKKMKNITTKQKKFQV